MTVKVRFAPSPTGRLHVGNIRTALMNWLYARSNNGKFVLRLDDTDKERSTEKFALGIEDDLNWLGLEFDEKFKQSDRFDRYDEVAEKLKTEGLLYPCYESEDELDRKRKILRSRGRPPIYDRAALKLSDDERKALEAEGRAPHWRFKLSGKAVAWEDLVRGPVSLETSNVSDPILIREDNSYLYTLPSVIDDIDMGITHIIRGEDHVTNSGTQIEIFAAVGGEAPLFGHHPLILGADGHGLSKRLGSLSIESLRENGIEAMAINSYLAKIGTSDAIEIRASLDEILSEFSLDKLNRAPAKFDADELNHLNARLIHDMPYERVKDKLAQWNIPDAETLWDVVSPNLTKVEDIKQWADIINAEIDPVIDDVKVTQAAADLLPNEVTNETWSAWTNAVKEQTGAKGKKLFMPLRMALTGLSHGPEMAKLLPLIGAEKAKSRLMGNRA